MGVLAHPAGSYHRCDGADATPGPDPSVVGDTRMSTPRLRSLLWLATAAAVPVAVTLAWVPVRNRFPNIDVALALVVVVMALGASGRRNVVIVAAGTAALAFEFFETKPFEQLAIARSPDVWTTVVLATVGLLAGLCVVGLARQRVSIEARAADMRRVRTASDLVASGQEAVLIVQQVAQELERLLQLQSCSFEAVPSHVDVPEVERDGTLRKGSSAMPMVALVGGPGDRVELPVWGQGQILGHFVLQCRPDVPVNRDQLRVAVTLADQVGAALTAYSPTGPLVPEDEGQPPGALRIVR